MPPSGGTRLGFDTEAVRVLLLDLDGVLVDTRPVMERAWHQVRADHSLHMPFEEYERHLGRPFADIMEQLGLADAEPIHLTYSKASTDASHLARQFDGVAEVLHAFAAADWRMGIVTSKPLERATPLLAQLGVPFATVHTPNGVGRGRPAPDPIMLALIDLGADPADALYVGDMAVDQEAASRAGVSYVHAGWGYGTPSSPAAVVAESPKDLLRLVDTGPFLEGTLAMTPPKRSTLGIAQVETDGKPFWAVGLRSSSSWEYRAYTVTWSGIAYLLGAAAPHNPLHSAQLRNLPPLLAAAAVPGPAPSELPLSEVVALSWSSRHAATLLPVLEELARNGHPSLVVDLATDSAERCPASEVAGVNLCSPLTGLFDLSGAVDGLRRRDDARVVRVDEHEVRLDRLVRLVSVLLETSGGCAQPSWRSVVRAETWLDGVLTAARPHTSLRIAVRDGTPGAATLRVPGDKDDSGRGLQLVQALVQESGGTWGTSGDGAETWCGLALPAGAAA
ncbi:HAD family hydrolase [Streptomyces pilosus]|uniref:HAD family hydrolase n=1 Tax=Streptomyces pilosus TaxID=28893 RepID=UPI001F1E6F8C|nr:HAD family hydrolase [Streptomyces pilosus]